MLSLSGVSPGFGKGSGALILGFWGLQTLVGILSVPWHVPLGYRVSFSFLLVPGEAMKKAFV